MFSTARTAEAATSTACSKESASYAADLVSRTTVVVGSVVSTCSRTTRVPRRAVERQWIWRGSSPGTYSRSAEKVTVPSRAFSWVRPS